MSSLNSFLGGAGPNAQKMNSVSDFVGGLPKLPSISAFQGTSNMFGNPGGRTPPKMNMNDVAAGLQA